jgi:hypothetical protein
VLLSLPVIDIGTRREVAAGKSLPGAPAQLLGNDETIMSARRNIRATKSDYETRVFSAGDWWSRQMIEAVAIIVGLFGAGVFAFQLVEAHLRAGDWLRRLRSVKSMYRLAS